MKQITMYTLRMLLLLLVTTQTLLCAPAGAEQEIVYKQEIEEALVLPTFMQKVMALKDIAKDRAVLDAEGMPTYTTSNQADFFTALQTLVTQSTGKDSASMIALKELLINAANSTSSLLSKASKTALKSTTIPQLEKDGSTPSSGIKKLPTTQQATTTNPGIKRAIMPSGAAEQLQPSAPAGIVKLPQSSVSTATTVSGNAIPITSQMIQMAMERTTMTEKIANLNALLTLAKGFSFNSDVQNTFAQELVELTQHGQPSSPKLAKALKIALKKATQTTLLSSEQQTHVRKNMLKKIKLSRKPKHRNSRRKMRTHQKKSQRFEARQTRTLARITKALQLPTTAKQIKRLVNVLRKARNKKFVPKTQDAFGNALVSLFNKQEQFKPKEKMLLKKLLILSRKTPLLSAEQKKYVTEQMIPKLK